MQGAAMYSARRLRLCTEAVSGTALPRCRARVSRSARNEEQSAARSRQSLMQTVEDLFPKQRRASVVHEYTTAITARHRRYKNLEQQPPPDCVDLSGDILLHVFKSLDARSLATASAVCKEWNVAATDDRLWHPQFLYLFGSPDLGATDDNATAAAGRREPDETHQKDQTPLQHRGGIWRKAFNLAAKGQPSHLFTSHRACCSICNEVLWLVEPAGQPTKGKCVGNKQILEHHSPKPMSVSHVVRYVVCRDIASVSESSSTDSDEE